jgi:hypothetical protein
MDAAWRAINAYNAAERQVGVHEVLKTACAVIVPAGMRGGQAHTRELWVFYMAEMGALQLDEQYIEALGDLQRE